MTVRQARREIDSREFAEWIAYYCLEPFGDHYETPGDGKADTPEKMETVLTAMAAAHGTNRKT